MLKYDLGSAKVAFSPCLPSLPPLYILATVAGPNGIYEGDSCEYYLVLQGHTAQSRCHLRCLGTWSRPCWVREQPRRGHLVQHLWLLWWTQRVLQLGHVPILQVHIFNFNPRLKTRDKRSVHTLISFKKENWLFTIYMGKPVCSRIGQIYYFHIGHNVPSKHHHHPPPQKKKKIAESLSWISLGTTVILKRNWQHRYAKFIN